MLTTPRLVMTLTALSAILTTVANQPKLVVGIVVDGLRQETLDMLSPRLQAGGFNRFLNDGVVFDNVDFGTNLDATAATAMLMTGASPKVSGISADHVYSPTARRTEHVFADNGYNGNFTEQRLSPQSLKLTTLSDELRIAGAGVTYVYAIAPTAAQALVLGSHAANSAVWFNENSGNWATSTFYGALPAPAMNANRTHSLASRIDTMQWGPSVTTALAASLPDHLTRYPFRYTFNGKPADKYVNFASSPFLNTEIADLALKYVKSMELGAHDGTDVLNLAFSLQPYEFSKTPENRYELYDSYVKLDNSLAELFSAIDSTIGRDNVVIYLSGTPPTTARRRDDDKWKIPSGEFSSRKAVSLLNLYLIALHGNGEWVTAFNNGHFYLNAELANTLDKDINLLRRQSADFLVRMSGVGHAYTIDDIVNAAPIVPNAQGLARNTVIEHSGDVVVELIPGWRLLDDYNFIGETVSELTYYLSPATSSFMISAPDLKAHRINTPVDARAIAPAIAGSLHIRSPNGASTPPVSFK